MSCSLPVGPMSACRAFQAVIECSSTKPVAVLLPGVATGGVVRGASVITVAPRARYQSAVQPPSITKDDPVISDEASDASRTIAPNKSATLPTRPSLIFDRTSALNAGFVRKLLASGVSTKVGQIVLTRI